MEKVLRSPAGAAVGVVACCLQPERGRAKERVRAAVRKRV
jgi:hypothetical protein